MPSFTVFKGSKDGKIVKSETTKDELTSDQVLVKVTASGLCGTDEHYRHADMGLGHEGAGVVQKVGPAVRKLKEGDRVGWGYEHNSCGSCTWCLTGRETYCPEREMYGYANLDQGSFASHGVWRESFLFKIPDALTDAEAAPLMCGGATVFNALHTYNIKSTDRVGVIGVGGLGHLAIQFAARMGCDVVVFSGSDSKEKEARQLGASEFISMKGKKELDIGRKLDALLVCTSSLPDWSLVLPVMGPTSIIFPLTVSDGNFEIPHMGLVAQGITVQGSVVAARAVHQQMLTFAAQHGIKPIMMKFPMTESGIEEAMQTLADGKMRYRGVLVPQ
ncbi:GroES-like protein [Dothidotthia symphoricarpi CBS 119687]|uniref:GroES-like protein n=1 Tax=Dothidotthia symphoricarpi CBS 119687 TaxID=1392245 RepID=A0A6A6AQJ3_9PLEO|nr:GroES-like protein [Dothidotthia symphoricarpi CBS 119687]KAF2133796.1 GroES-like protein [Dothidotthia symphoricarpi CBS 119687]